MTDRMADKTAGERCTCNLPVLGDVKAFKDNIYETWLSVPGIRAGIGRSIEKSKVTYL